MSRPWELEDAYAENKRLRAINAELRSTNTTLALNGLNLKASNAELLAALEAVVPFTGTTGSLSAMAYGRALAVIAKTKGETP